MLKLSKECKKLLVFTHVSTAYVNCVREGIINEAIYDPNVDVSTIVAGHMRMNPGEIAEK